MTVAVNIPKIHYFYVLSAVIQKSCGMRNLSSSQDCPVFQRMSSILNPLNATNSPKYYDNKNISQISNMLSRRQYCPIESHGSEATWADCSLWSEDQGSLWADVC
jgi:hypothetical protein